MKRALVLGGILVWGTAMAQQSASYRLEEHVLNIGGHPADGGVLGSPSYLVRLDAIGDAVAGASPASASYTIDGGFVGSYPPPGEVRDVRFQTKTAFDWRPERSVGVYNVYRNLVSTLPGDFGTCFPGPFVTNSATDGTTPAAGTCLFYLVTAENRIAEEGTKGYSRYRSSNAERPNPAPCP